MTSSISDFYFFVFAKVVLEFMICVKFDKSMNSKRVFCPFVAQLFVAVAPLVAQDAALAVLEPNGSASEPVPVAAVVESNESTGNAAAAAAPGAAVAVPEKGDYSQDITQSLKERERRLTLLNEAMIKLHEAGEPEDAKRVEERIKALLAFPVSVHVEESRKEADFDHLRVKNEDLSLQVRILQDQLAKLRGESPKKSGNENAASGTDLDSTATARRAEVRRVR